MNINSKKDVDLIQKTMRFIVDAHYKQFRKGSKSQSYKKIPYVFHCYEVTKILSNMGVSCVISLCACLLHDVIEDCDVTYDDLKKEFGKEIADIVMECSRDGGDDVNKQQKYEFLETFANKSSRSIEIKIADRYANTKDYLTSKGKEDYASTYALQAYPLYQAYLNKGGAVADDTLVREILEELSQIIQKKYSGFSIYQKSMEGYVKQKVI